MKTSPNIRVSERSGKHIMSPRWYQKREQIFVTAAHLIRQNGYKETSLNAIAKAANMNKSTIYYYFNNKLSILYGIASKNIRSLTEQAKEIANSDLKPEEKLKRMIISHIKWQLSHPLHSGIIQYNRNLPKKVLRFLINMRDEYEAFYRRVYADGTATGKFRPLEPKLASMFILGFINSIPYWFKANGELSVDEVAEEAYRFLALNSSSFKQTNKNKKGRS